MKRHLLYENPSKLLKQARDDRTQFRAGTNAVAPRGNSEAGDQTPSSHSPSMMETGCSTSLVVSGGANLLPITPGTASIPHTPELLYHRVPTFKHHFSNCLPTLPISIAQFCALWNDDAKGWPDVAASNTLLHCGAPVCRCDVFLVAISASTGHLC
uniref:Uncharacterized protein n=1 Tax=Mesocestoides corti TaxID=53468 RepID=A0A5K3FZ80_MESCO